MSQFRPFGEWDIYSFLYKHLPFVVESTGQTEVFTAKMIYGMYHLLPSNLLKKYNKPNNNPNPQIISSIEDTKKLIASSRVLTPEEKCKSQQFSKLL